MTTKYVSNQVLELEPEFEQRIYDDDEIQTVDETVTVECRELVHNDDNPFITYWEIVYEDDTLVADEGETAIVDEYTLAGYEVLTGKQKVTITS